MNVVNGKMDKKIKKAMWDRENRLRDQMTVIERVQQETGLTVEEIAASVAVKPETIRKYLGGYQPASRTIIQLIEAIPARMRDASRGEQAAKEIEKNLGPPPSTAGLSRSRWGDRRPSLLAIKLDYVLERATYSEQAVVRAAVNELHSICRKRELGGEKDLEPIIKLAQGWRMRPLLGDIAAGLPQEAIAQADEYIKVPPPLADDTSFVLRARGDSMIDAQIFDGDLVALSTSREPRNLCIVAALIDGETTLKTYVVEKAKVYLRSENKKFPPQIVPRDEMTIQGVMVGKLQKNEKL